MLASGLEKEEIKDVLISYGKLWYQGLWIRRDWCKSVSRGESAFQGWLLIHTARPSCSHVLGLQRT